VHDKILILDFGAQYSQLIARRVREAKVYCELHPFDVSDGFIRDFAPRGVILSGGPASVYEDATPKAPAAVFKLGVPVLGICYGMQTMAAAAARSRIPGFANSATPKCARAAIPGSSRASRTASTARSTGCSTCG
jgi:GMP synthase (glutamine-hydrolysing)